MSLYRSPSASVMRSASMLSRSGGFDAYGFGGYGAPSLNVADLGSLTRLELIK
ncbi:hypothetical protein T03_11062 [Trichinella britovi]|uniref:Uncharacterized protein n=1 Tax=Trichinella britovi TaxID=45882 RepID=A0A0V1C799_TRIBR|nr:hypothetical protein T03_11062 [Trichinella britovi]